jgi:hypothetical protein
LGALLGSGVLLAGAGLMLAGGLPPWLVTVRCEALSAALLASDVERPRIPDATQISNARTDRLTTSTKNRRRQ